MKRTKLILLIISMLIIISAIFAIPNKSVAMSNYYEPGFVTGLVTATSLNVRQGPGTNFKSVGMIYKNEYIRVFAAIGDWYIIQTNSDLIGAVSKGYIKEITRRRNWRNNK